MDKEKRSALLCTIRSLKISRTRSQNLLRTRNRQTGKRNGATMKDPKVIACQIFEQLSKEDRSAIMDQLVLDEFDPLDWFCDPLPKGALHCLANMIENWEQGL
jgi:hypothetical protein